MASGRDGVVELRVPLASLDGRLAHIGSLCLTESGGLFLALLGFGLLRIGLLFGDLLSFGLSLGLNLLLRGELIIGSGSRRARLSRLGKVAELDGVDGGGDGGVEGGGGRVEVDVTSVEDAGGSESARGDDEGRDDDGEDDGNGDGNEVLEED